MKHSTAVRRLRRQSCRLLELRGSFVDDAHGRVSLWHSRHHGNTYLAATWRHPFEAWSTDPQTGKRSFSATQFGYTAESDLKGNPEDLRRSYAILANDLALDDSVFEKTNENGETLCAL